MHVQRCVGARRLVALVVGASAPFLVAGCSSSSAPSLFPAVLDTPRPRAEAPLSPDQVKQATDDLISDRDRTEAKAGAAQSAAATNGPATTGSIPQKKSAASAQPAAQQSSSGISAYAKQ